MPARMQVPWFLNGMFQLPTIDVYSIRPCRRGNKQRRRLYTNHVSFFVSIVFSRQSARLGWQVVAELMQSINTWEVIKGSEIKQGE